MTDATASLRVAMVAPFALWPKGTTRWRALPLARALAAAGCQVRLIIPPHDWPNHSGWCWQEGRLEVLQVGLAGGPALIAGRLLQAVLSWQPGAVHCFKPHGYSGWVAWVLSTLPLPGIRVVIDFDDWETGWSERIGHPALWRFLFARQERWGLLHAHAVTVASRWLEERAIRLRGVRRGVLYLPNGVEPVPLGRAVRPMGERPRVLLYTRFVEHTPQQVWDVWKQVLAQVPAAQLLVAGRGLLGEEQILMGLARMKGLEHTLRLLGWVPAVSRAGLFAAADAALLPVADHPLNRAKSPMRLLDLLAAGVPVVTQAVGEYGVYVVDGQTGLVVPPGDDQALATAVVRLLGDGTRRNRLGNAAIRYVAEAHAWPHLARAALDAYEG